MPRKISLNAIRYFECTARHLSFTKAAAELFVTQGAVSKQIRRLEDQLGRQLYVRKGPNLALTSHGSELAKAVGAALETINQSLDNIFRERACGLKISLLPSFASLWLLPRLHDFESRFPDVTVRIDTSYIVVDLFSDNETDCAIRLTKTKHDEKGLFSLKLTEGRMFPVCTPKIAQSLKSTKDLQNSTILKEMNPRDEWSNWFKAQGEVEKGNKVRHYEDTGLQLEAALKGLGVMLVREELVHSFIESGALVKPFEIEFQSDAHYYFVCLESRVNEEALSKFIEWLREGIN